MQYFLSPVATTSGFNQPHTILCCTGLLYLPCRVYKHDSLPKSILCIKTSSFLKACSWPQIHAIGTSVLLAWAQDQYSLLIFLIGFVNYLFKPSCGIHYSHLVSYSQWKLANPLVCRQPSLILTLASYPSRQLFLWHCVILQDYMQEQFHTTCWYYQH